MVSDEDMLYVVTVRWQVGDLNCDKTENKKDYFTIK